MSTLPVVTVFVRHSPGCKYAGDEFCHRCNCRKHLRWTQNGTQYRRKAGTRSWEEAEEVKRRLQDDLAGRTPAPDTPEQTISAAVDLFVKEKRIQGVTDGVVARYESELRRFCNYCQRENVFTVRRITRELLVGYADTWADIYGSSNTRVAVRARLRTFLRQCFEYRWIDRIPSVPRVEADEQPTMPLTNEEYDRLLDAIHIANPRRWDGKISTQGLTAPTRARIHALFQLMRWSGLSIRDAVTLKRSEIQHDEAKRIFRIVTARQKTGTHVSVPIPAKVAEEILAVANGNEQYIFWTGEGSAETIAKTWANRYVRPVFEAAKIPSEGHMLSHRLRDTFAVDLLTRGVPLEDVSKLLGHTSIKTTERYYAKWVKSRQVRLDALVIATWS